MVSLVFRRPSLPSLDSPLSLLSTALEPKNPALNSDPGLGPDRVKRQRNPPPLLYFFQCSTCHRTSLLRPPHLRIHISTPPIPVQILQAGLFTQSTTNSLYSMYVCVCMSIRGLPHVKISGFANASKASCFSFSILTPSRCTPVDVGMPESWKRALRGSDLVTNATHYSMWTLQVLRVF